MKNNISHSKLNSYLNNSRFCTLIGTELQHYRYYFTATNKTLDIPVQETYSLKFLQQLFEDNGVITIPFSLFWLYVEII